MSIKLVSALSACWFSRSATRKKVRWGGVGAGEICTLGLRKALHEQSMSDGQAIRQCAVRVVRVQKQSTAQKVGTLISTSCSRTKQCKTVLKLRHHGTGINKVVPKRILHPFTIFPRRTDRENQTDGSCAHAKLINMLFFYS